MRRVLELELEHTNNHCTVQCYNKITITITFTDKSSAVAEMGDRGHNRHGPKRGGRCAPLAQSWDPV